MDEKTIPQDVHDRSLGMRSGDSEQVVPIPHLNIAGATGPDEIPTTVLQSDDLNSQTVLDSGPVQVPASAPGQSLNHQELPRSERASPNSIGPYELLEVVGSGGMGVVTKAIDRLLRRVVAIKTLAPVFSAHPQARLRFLREAQAAAAVRHNNIVTVYSVDNHGDSPFLVMEYIEGRSLEQRILADGPLPILDVVRIARETAAGLAAAHAVGLVHRDVKPANILLESPSGRVKITDFGLARAATDSGITLPGNVAGTPLYMSPEQANGSPVDQRSDLFSLGSVMYAMCTGASPFRSETAVVVLRKVCDDRAVPISKLRPGTPRDLCLIVDKLLAKRPEDRFQTAAEVEQVLRNLQTRIRSGTVAVLEGSPRRPWRKWFVSGAALIVVLLLLAVIWLNQRPANRSAESSTLQVESDSRQVIGPATADAKHDVSPINLVPAGPAEADASEYVLQFDGRSSYVKVPELSCDAASPYTLECWTRPMVQRQARAVLVLAGSSFLQIAKSENGFFAMSHDVVPEPSEQNTRFIPGNWVHLAVVKADGQLRRFVNGELQCSQTVSGKRVLPGYPFEGLWIGAHAIDEQTSQIAYHFQGEIDEIRLSKSSRYHQPFTPQRRFEADGDTIALYHCDEGEGDRLKDASGNAHHGQMIKAKWISQPTKQP